MSEFNVRRRSD